MSTRTSVAKFRRRWGCTSRRSFRHPANRGVPPATQSGPPSVCMRTCLPRHRPAERGAPECMSVLGKLRLVSVVGRGSMVAVVGAQAVGQLALIAVLPVLTRSFTPQELGPYQVALAVALVVQPLLTLRFEVYIPTASSRAGSLRLFRRSLKWAISVTIVVLLAGLTVGLTTSAAVGDVLIMTALLSLAYGGSAIDSALLIRRSKRRRLALRNLLGGVTGAGLQVMVALLLPIPILLAGSVLLGRFLAVAITRERIRNETDVALDRDVPTARRIASLIASGMLWNLSFQGFVLTVGGSGGNSAAAIAGTAQRIAGAPVSFVGQAINQLVQEATAREIREPSGKLTRTVCKQLAFLVALGVFIAAITTFLAPALAGPLLGDEWVQVGVMIAILIWPFALQLAVGPVTVVLPMMALERKLLRVQIIRSMFIIAVMVSTMFLDLGLVGAAFLFSAAVAFSYVILIVVLVSSAMDFDRDQDSNKG